MRSCFKTLNFKETFLRHSNDDLDRIVANGRFMRLCSAQSLHLAVTDYCLADVKIPTLAFKHGASACLFECLLELGRRA